MFLVFKRLHHCNQHLKNTNKNKTIIIKNKYNNNIAQSIQFRQKLKYLNIHMVYQIYKSRTIRVEEKCTTLKKKFYYSCVALVERTPFVFENKTQRNERTNERMNEHTSLNSIKNIPPDCTKILSKFSLGNALFMWLHLLLAVSSRVFLGVAGGTWNNCVSNLYE